MRTLQPARGRARRRGAAPLTLAAALHRDGKVDEARKVADVSGNIVLQTVGTKDLQFVPIVDWSCASHRNNNFAVCTSAPRSGASRTDLGPSSSRRGRTVVDPSRSHARRRRPSAVQRVRPFVVGRWTHGRGRFPVIQAPRDTNADDRSQGTADVARRRRGGRTLECGSSINADATGADGRSNVRCSRRQSRTRPLAAVRVVRKPPPTSRRKPTSACSAKRDPLRILRPLRSGHPSTLPPHTEF